MNAVIYWLLGPAWENRQPAAVSYLRRPGDSEFRAFDARLREAFGGPELLDGEGGIRTLDGA